MTIKRILCPTDLSAESDEALRYALALARAYEAKLITFHCQPANDSAGLADVKALFERSLFQHLDFRALTTIDWERVVGQCDDPGRAITEYAAEHGVDLIPIELALSPLLVKLPRKIMDRNHQSHKQVRRSLSTPNLNVRSWAMCRNLEVLEQRQSSHGLLRIQQK